MRGVLGAALAAMAAVAPPALGQTPVRVFSPDTRLRIDAPALDVRRGVMRVVAQHRDTLQLVPSDEPGAERVSVRFAELTRLDVSRGYWPSVSRGGTIGAAAGAVVIAAVAYGASDDPARCTLFFCNFDSRGRRVVEGGMVGAAVGAALGGLVGAVVLGERWERVLPPRAAEAER